MTLLYQVLKEGCKGPEVEVLQQRLCAAGFPVTVDGDFGPATSMAVMQLQLKHFLVVDGIAGPKTQAHLLGEDTETLLSHRDLEEAAVTLGVDVAAVRAVQ